MKNIRIITLTIILFLNGCAGQLDEVAEPITSEDLRLYRTSETLISPELLKADLKQLRKAVIDIHPQPFVRSKQADFDRDFDQVYNSIIFGLSQKDFYLKIAPLLASLNDIHSLVQFPKIGVEEAGELIENLFPLAVVIDKNKVYVAADLTPEQQVPSGAQIVNINHAPISYFLEKMRQLTAKETDTGQTRNIQLNFSRYLPAIGHSDEDYVIEYRWQGQHFIVNLKAIKQKLVASNGKITSYYGYSPLNHNTALLWMNDFHENPEKFDDYLQDKFALMQKTQIKNLIIDMRYNKGGLLENLKSLLGRMINQSIEWASSGVIKASEALKENHQNKTRQRRQDKYSWGLQWLPLEWADVLQHKIVWAGEGEIIAVDIDPVEVIEGYRPNKIWVLTNGYCYSACSLFAASVNYYKLGQTVGEKPGSLVDVQFAYPITTQLKHSGLKVTLPTMQINFVGSDNKGYGKQDPLEPNISVQRSFQDIINRQDSILNRALKEAAKK
ncbi:MAG: S41 family peptidase [Gammaproteobacteria bacterium]|nr:S41 family peptidase [Gammaproteobacteria bacterium]MDH5628916.1 S41 family peptidase [Gammaproteobacteria bacterium]